MGREGVRDDASREGDQSPENATGLLPRAVAYAAGRCPRMQHTMLAGGIAVFAASVAGLAVVEVASPGQRSMLDLQIYRWAGLVVTHSGDLYGSHFPHYHLFFTYTPMAGLVFAALSAIPLAALRWLVTAGSVASLAGTLWLTWGMLGYRRSRGRLGMTLTAAGVALWLLPVQQTLGLGQVNLILMLIIVADLCQPDTAWTKGAGVGLAAGFKLTPLIFIPYLVLTRRFRAAGLSLAVFGLTIAGSLILLPRQARQFWFGGLFLTPGRTGNTAYVGNQSLDGALVRLLDSVPAARPYWLGISVAICAAGLLFAAWTARRGQEMTGILICALTGLLVSPISWSHHWVWMAPALVVAADAAIRRGTPVPALRPGRETVRLTSRGRWPVWRRWACWTGLVAVIIPFFALPQDLVPRSAVQDTDGYGTQLLTSNLYVIDGFIILCLAGILLVVHKFGEPATAKAGDGNLGLEEATPTG